MKADHPTDAPSPAITVLLARMRAGEPEARDHLVAAVYQELKKIARQQLRGERPGNSLQASALVNELYLRMLGRHDASWENRAHFFTVAASTMRRILIDQARARQSGKRGGGLDRVNLDQELLISAETDGDEAAMLLALDAALADLARMDERQARIVELRFFAGLTADETASAMGLSRRTVMREWSMARAWLHGRINGAQAVAAP